MQKLVVYKAKDLVIAKGDLEILQGRLFDFILGKMNQELEIDSTVEYEINVSDFAERFNLDPSWAYQELKEGFSGLMEKTFTVPALMVNDEERPETAIKSNWLQHIAYNDKERFLRVRFTDTVAKLVSKLDKSKGFLKFDLDDKKFLSSFYHTKLYDLLRSNLFKTTYKITLLELKRILDIEYKYKTFGQFRESILEPALEAINSTTDIRVSYKVDKLGTRAVQELIFNISARLK